MPMYNFIEYSDNYSDTSCSLRQFKKDEIKGDFDLTVDNINIFQIICHHLSIYQVYIYKQKWCKNSCTAKTFQQLLEIVRNTIDSL